MVGVRRCECKRAAQWQVTCLRLGCDAHSGQYRFARRDLGAGGLYENTFEARLIAVRKDYQLRFQAAIRRATTLQARLNHQLAVIITL